MAVARNNLGSQLKMSKLLVIGLDGATWDLLKRWVEEEKLPTIKKLKDGGVWGKLESTIPPVTGPSWLSFATGMNPGKTGVFDFLIRRKGRYSLRTLSSEAFRGKALWDILSDQGKKVGVVNFPMLYPPYRINGFMISGDLTFPMHLKKEINEVAGGYEVVVDYHNERYDDEELFLVDMNRVLKKRAKVIRYLMKKENWDVLIVIFRCTDWIQHLMWKHVDRSHPNFDTNKSQRYSLEILRFWQKIDRSIKSMIEYVREDVNVFVVSDHGFGPQYGCFNINKWLEKKGYLRRKPRERMKTTFKRVLNTFLPTSAKSSLREIMYNKTVKETDVLREIDFEKSMAYTLGHTIPFGAIYLNVKGRDPKGFIDVGKQYEALKEKIIKELKNLPKDIDRNVEVEILDPQKVYRGGHVNEAPDVLFTINGWSCVVVKNFSNPLYKDAPYSNRHTGSHRLNGIFLAYGSSIKKGRIEGAKIFDIAPTILHTLKVSIPENVDGRVLKEIFRNESEPAKRKPSYSKISLSEKKRIKAKIRELKSAAKI